MGWRRSKIILYVAFAVSGLAIAGIRTVSLTLDHAAALRRAEQAAADMGAVLEEHARRVFENADLIADLAAGLAARSAESGDGAYPLHQELADLAGRMATSGGIAVLDAGGTPVAMSDRFPPALPDVTGQGWWKAHVERGQERVVGGLSADPATGEARFTYSRSLIGDDGRFRGVVLLSLRPAFFESFRFPAELDREAEIAMLRADGMLVARNPPLPPGAQLDRGRLLLRGTAKGGSAFREVSPADGVERLYAVRHLDRWPVLVAAGVSVDSALIAWRQGLAWSGAILALVLLFLAAAVWFGGRASDREARALQDAETANRRLAASLADKELLFREMHHRIKNNLQIVSSLLQIQRTQFDDAAVQAAFEETASRIRTIGIVHQTLYQSESSAEVECGQFLRPLVEGMAETYGARQRGVAVTLDVQPWRTDLDRAVTLALIVTEVLTNAFKHAFPPGRGGEIRLAGAREADAYLLEVRDTGRGMPEGAGNGTSIGLTLIRSLSAQLNASHGFETADGTLFRLRVPLGPGG